MSVVIITGAGQGQGAAEARLLAAKGATVIATNLGEAPTETIPGAEYRQLDVTDEAGWAALQKDLAERFGRVDGLVANAGITWRARLLDVTPADLRRVHEVNVTGALLAIQAVAPLMTAGGSVVLVGSAAALTGHFPAAYTASKWALRGLAKVACLELGPRGVRVNTIHPGYIETSMTASAAPAFRAANLAETPLGRTGAVDDVAPLVAFLLSEQASFISGARDPGRWRHDRPRRREIHQRRGARMTGRLAGKVALITGTAGGQGRAAALLFAAEGATVAGTDVNADGAAETVALVGRIGTPEDVARSALFLASDEASYVTGANLVIDGGWSAVLPGAS